LNTRRYHVTLLQTHDINSPCDIDTIM